MLPWWQQALSTCCLSPAVMYQSTMHAACHTTGIFLDYKMHSHSGCRKPQLSPLSQSCQGLLPCTCGVYSADVCNSEVWAGRVTRCTANCCLGPVVELRSRVCAVPSVLGVVRSAKCLCCIQCLLLSLSLPNTLPAPATLPTGSMHG